LDDTVPVNTVDCP
jgi:hypothetical protein